MKSFKQHLHESGFLDSLRQEIKQKAYDIVGISDSDSPFGSVDTTPGPFSENPPPTKPQTEEDFKKSFGGPGTLKSDSEVFKDEPATQKTHVVQKGDTLWDIAGKNPERVNELMRLNQGINPKKLQIGQRVRIK